MALRSYPFPLIVILLGLSGSQLGCSGGTSNPETPQATVSGKVTYDGKPLTVDSAVLFSCEDCPGMAAGKVDVLGNFNLKAADPAVGIPVGRYRVAVQPPSVTAAAPMMGDPQYEEMMKRGGASTTAKPAAPPDIPESFLTLQSSPLVLELKEGSNTFEFDLKELDKK